jgi:hypothetical protein
MWNYVLNLEFVVQKILGKLVKCRKNKVIFYKKQELNLDGLPMITAQEPKINCVFKLGEEETIPYLFKSRICSKWNQVVLNTQSGLVYKNGNRLIPESSSWPNEELVKDAYTGSKVQAKLNLQFECDDYLYTCLPSNGFYHWLIEDLPRYLFLRENTSQELKTIIYSKRPRYVNDVSNMLNLDIAFYPRIIKVKEFVLAEKSKDTGFPNPNDIKLLRKTFLNDKTRDQNDKVYVSRRSSSRSPVWESELEARLQDEGWKVIFCEKLSLEEQIMIFKNARVICGIHGAGLSGMVWADSSTKIIELNEKFRSNCFLNLAQLLDLEFNQIRTESMNIENDRILECEFW